MVVVSLIAGLALGTAVAADSGTSLIQAVRSGAIDRVRELLRTGVDVNGSQGDGATALHWAVHRSDLAATELLVRAGADVNRANERDDAAVARQPERRCGHRRQAAGCRRRSEPRARLG
jgi:ankyrin repeat protein